MRRYPDLSKPRTKWYFRVEREDSIRPAEERTMLAFLMRRMEWAEEAVIAEYMDKGFVSYSGGEAGLDVVLERGDTIDIVRDMPEEWVGLGAGRLLALPPVAVGFRACGSRVFLLTSPGPRACCGCPV